ncbi:hypothetical protein [Rodentibacter myodis]|nr:hypothetical protein [Rodentibacter myodis]
MFKLKKTGLIFTALLVSTSACTSIKSGSGNIKKVKSIDIQVIPYYSALGGKVEWVNVYNEIDPLLASNRFTDYQKAVEIVEKDPALVTPITMFTLAARSYDFGKRDDAVKWFYRGRDRLITALYVLNLPKMSEVEYVDFSKLVGSVINPYAFCDFAKQEKAAEEAVKWVKANPYQAIFYEKIPSKYSDRKKALKESEAELDKRLIRQKNYLSNSKHKQEFLQQREKNQVQQRFCW